MQQTKTYKLNLIESSDAFLPAPLNENMEKVEAALAKAETARSGAEKKLEQRIAALEIHKIAVGSYRPKANLSVNVGFEPKIVLIHGGYPTYLSGALLPAGYGYPQQSGTITKTGFQLGAASTSNAVNHPDYVYGYVALA